MLNFLMPYSGLQRWRGHFELRCDQRQSFVFQLQLFIRTKNNPTHENIHSVDCVNNLKTLLTDKLDAIR